MDHGPVSEALAEKIRLLRARIEAQAIPASKLDESLNFATWNIRDFGKTRRSKDGIHLIAEILYQFDLIALVEVRDDLSDLGQVMRLLGPYWKVVFSDFGMDRAGNKERVAFLFDKRMVAFTGLAAEADPPKKKINGVYTEQYNWWRSPYMASFAAGSFDFVVMASHIRWGSSVSERQEALKNLGDWIRKRTRNRNVLDRDWIIAGDFNIPKIGDPLYKALAGNHLVMPKQLEGVRYVNVAGAIRGGRSQKNYDQILHVKRVGRQTSNTAGVLDFASDNLMGRLFPNLDQKARTYQLSDHLPLWVQINTDLDDLRLDAAIQQNVSGQ